MLDISIQSQLQPFLKTIVEIVIEISETSVSLFNLNRNQKSIINDVKYYNFLFVILHQETAKKILLFRGI